MIRASVGRLVLAASACMAAGCAILPSGHRDPGAAADPASGGRAAVTRSDSSAIERALEPVWRQDIGRGVSAAPVRVDSMVVLGTADRRLLALDLADGRRRWIRGTRGPFTAGLSTGATDAGKNAASGADVHVYAVSDGREGMLRSVAARSGGFAWTADVGPSSAPPVIAGDLVVAATSRGQIVAVERAGGRTRWTVELGEPLSAAPVLVGDSLLIASGLGGSAVGLRVRDGSEVSHFAAASGVEAGLLAAGNQLLLPSRSIGMEARTIPDGELLWKHVLPRGCIAASIEGAHVITLSPDGLLSAVRLADGGAEWSVRLPGVYDRSLTVGPRTILAGGVDGKLRIVSRDGRFLGEWDAGEPLLAPAILWRSRVFVAGSRGHAWLLAASGDTLAVPLAGRTGSPFDPVREGVTDEVPLMEHQPLIYTVPFNAEATLGDSVLGTTPLALPSGTTPGARLRLRYPGFEPRELDLDSLRASEAPLRIVLDPVARPSGRGDGSGSSWLGRGLMSLAGALACGVGAYYASERADDAYRDYRQTADPEDQRDHFDRAERWDRISVVCWGVTQVAVGVTLYCFMRHDAESSRPAPAGKGWNEQ